MNNKLLIGIWLCIAMSATVCAQDAAPRIKWQRTIGGTSTDGRRYFGSVEPVPFNFKSLIKTRDKGYIVGGRTESSNGDAAGLSGFMKPWTVKLDSSRNFQWGKKAGTSATPNMFGSVIEATGGGYIMIGGSLDGDDSAYYEDSQVLLARYLEDGTTVWEKRIGGSLTETGCSIQKNGNSGYLVVGLSNSTDGDAASPSRGGGDLWLVNIDLAGNILWEKKYGGTGFDYGRVLKTSADGGFILGASTTSNNGDVSGAKGGEDVWILKLDAAGNISWQKVFGGSGKDLLYDIAQDQDGGYVFVGETLSNDLDVSGNHGQNDGWVVKLDNLGNIKWQKTIGGSQADLATSVAVLPGPYYVVAGSSTSSDGDITGNYGAEDIFLVKLNNAGNLIWSQNYGGSGIDFPYSVVADEFNELLVLGETMSNNNDVLGNKGQTDLWLFALGAANTLSGQVFFDMNSNGTRDAGEKNAENYKIVSDGPGGKLITTSFNGAYKIPVGLGSFNLTVELPNDYYLLNPASASHEFSTYFNTHQVDFALQPEPGKSDISISLLPITASRPGFDVGYVIVYKNYGTQSHNATIELLLDPHTTYLTANLPPSLVAAGSLSWTIPGLAPNSEGQIILTLTIKPPPTTNMGDTLVQKISILPIVGDVSPADNKGVVKQVVTGGYDPNDKQESNGGVITPEQVTAAEPLNYLIRFQNTGNDTAFTIVVRDTLTNSVLPGTFQMIGASHPYRLELKNNNQLTWIFDNIKLVDSNMNEPLSHGYIAYKIRPVPELGVGDTVFNSASIYFDYNLPVITNKEFTTVIDLLAVPVKLKYFRGLHSGEENKLFWEIETYSNFSHFEMERSGDGRTFTKLSSTAHNGNRKYKYEYIDPAPLAAVNFYRLKMVDVDGKFEYSPVVRLQQAVDAVLSLAVYPNPAQSAFQLDLQGEINGAVTVRIVNQVGHSLKLIQLGNQQANKMLIPVSVNHLSKGTYFVQVTVGEKKLMKKMVVQ